MAQTMEGMPFTYVPISTGGTVPVICANADPVYFTDDNNGGDNFQSPYTNQNHTITLCPDESDASLALDFLVFSLATGQSAIDNDVLYIYDGEDVDAPLLASGQEDQFEGVTVTASDANISGCITVEFVVNSGALGANPGWVALVTCATSCAHPTASIAVSSPASISGNSGAVGLCIEESVAMDASGSMPGMSGAALESLIWNWGDGTTESVSVLEGFEQSHAYLHPGTYDVSLVVQDALNCSSLNLAQVEVVASTKPLFNSVVSSPLCLNTTGQLDGTPVESVPWTFQPTFGVSENTTLSDITGVIFPSEIVVDAFAPGQTLEDCSQLETITANMFHEYVGDLTISVTCPNGTEVVLLENPSPSGGGGIQGADPNDCNLNASGMQEDLNLYRLGASVTEGYDYAWNMDALHVIDGVDNPHTVPNDETAQTGLILPETYLPCGNFCDFEGCPLNGVWTFNVLDQWPLGDGMLFGWNLAFNPAIAPDITTTQPTIGQGADSSFWHVVGDISVPLTSEVDGVEAVDSDGNVVDVLFETPGNYEFGFHAINNVGCASDTTVVIEVIASSNEALSAGPDLGYCDGPIQLLGSFEAVNSGGCDESSGIGQHCMGSNEDASFAFCPDVPGDGTMMSLRLMGGELELGTDVLTVFDGADEASAVLATLTGDVAGQTFTATNPTGCLFMTLTSDGSCDCMSDDECDFGPVQWCAHCGESPVDCDYNFMWEPAEMLDDPTLLQPTLLSFDGNPLTLVLTMSNEASDVCTATDTVMVTSGLDVLLEIGQASCAGNDGEAILSISSNADETESPIEIRLHALSDDSPLDVVMWTGQEVVFDGLTPGEYQIVVSNALGCTRTEGFTIDEPEIIFDDENVLDHIDVRLESSPTQFLDALGLPEVVTHSNGQEFPLQSWIDLQGTNLFDWEDGTVDGVAIEGCSDAFLRILRDANEADVSDVVSWQWGGGAVIGDDFSSAVQTVVLAPGEVEVIVPLVIVADSIEEGVEIVTVEYGYVDACGGNVWKNSRMVILDAISMQTDPGILACGNGTGGQFAEFNNIEGLGHSCINENRLVPSDPGASRGIELFQRLPWLIPMVNRCQTVSFSSFDGSMPSCPRIR